MSVEALHCTAAHKTSTVSKLKLATSCKLGAVASYSGGEEGLAGGVGGEVQHGVCGLLSGQGQGGQ